MGCSDKVKILPMKARDTNTARHCQSRGFRRAFPLTFTLYPLNFSPHSSSFVAYPSPFILYTFAFFTASLEPLPMPTPGTRKPQFVT
jgi:hypothetical protein